MRLKDLTSAHHTLLRALTNRVSRRLQTDFIELPKSTDANLGVELRERSKRMVIELPTDLLTSAVEDIVAREKLRIRIKAGRDRMLFEPPPPPLSRRLEAVSARADGRDFRSRSRRG